MYSLVLNVRELGWLAHTGVIDLVLAIIVLGLGVEFLEGGRHICDLILLVSWMPAIAVELS